jgi:hypothetical protein
MARLDINDRDGLQVGDTVKMALSDDVTIWAEIIKVREDGGYDVKLAGPRGDEIQRIYRSHIIDFLRKNELPR